MEKNKEKLVWTTPKVEKIDLEFDKEMASPCHGSSNQPNDGFIGSCGPGAGASSCWNSNNAN